LKRLKHKIRQVDSQEKSLRDYGAEVCKKSLPSKFRQVKKSV